MDNLQRETLQSLLRLTKKTPEPHRLEEVQAALNTRLQLYQNESDKAGALVYQRLKPLVEKAKSAQELEQLAS